MVISLPHHLLVTIGCFLSNHLAQNRQMSYRPEPFARPTTAPPNSKATVPIPTSRILALDAVLPINFRTNFSTQDIGNVIVRTIECLKGIRITNNAQSKEIMTLRKELADEKAKPKPDSTAITQTSETVDNNAGEDKTTQTLETLNQERADYQFCVAELVMFITGEGEARGKIDFSKLREVLQKAKEGGWNLKMVADAIELVAPVKPEEAGKRRNKWA